MNEHERGWRAGYDAAIHDAAIDGSTAREMLIASGVITPEPAQRLEYLRSQLDAECISMGELLELQNLAEHIEPGDVQLAEAAGIDEQEFAKR